MSWSDFTDFLDNLREQVDEGLDDWYRWQYNHLPTLDISAIGDFLEALGPLGKALWTTFQIAMCIKSPDFACVTELGLQAAGVDICVAGVRATLSSRSSAWSRAQAAQCMADNFRSAPGSRTQRPDYYGHDRNGTPICQTGFYLDVIGQMCRTHCPTGATKQGDVCVTQDGKRIFLQCPVGSYYDAILGCSPACPQDYLYIGENRCMKNPESSKTGPELVKSTIEFPKVFFTALGIALTGNEIFITDHYNNCVMVYDFNGTLKRRWGTLGTENGQFNLPTGIAVTFDGKVVVADSGNSRIQVFNELF
jgi:hypothetical protein